MTLTISELCFILITIALIVLITFLIINLKKTYNILTKVDSITDSVHSKVESVDEFLASLKEIDSFFKYAKTGFNLVKKIKKEKNDEKPTKEQ